MSGNKALKWNCDMQTAFNTLMEKLSTPPALAFPDSKSMFILETDASNFAVEAVLVQIGNDRTSHPVQFTSRTLTTAEKNYST